MCRNVSQKQTMLYYYIKVILEREKMPFCLEVLQSQPTRKFMVQRFKNKLIYSAERIFITAEQIQSLSVRVILFLKSGDH